ncbi:MAG TPA: sigma-70 family RNA polymerase sigma factor [Verrucomicrobiae bacterium]|nr:sigma-70 family RNA polymerase sigma factor [Verrucomicrobiae bacterium]
MGYNFAMNDLDDLIPTRQSLLSRLKSWNDQESWKVFFDTYWKLIYNASVKAGLTDAEAQDVVQETVISVLKSMPSFEYDAEKGSFKTWLLRLTSWRICDQFRKRQRQIEPLTRESDTSTKTDAIERIAAPTLPETVWDEDWEKNLFDAAIERVKRKVDSRQYQLFDLYVCKRWPVLKVAMTLGVNPGRVYLAKHRINNLIQKEIAKLRTKPI